MEKQSSSFISYNGAIIPAGKAVLTPDNRSFRYGDGLFETIRVREGRILLNDYHFERLMHGLKLLYFDPSPQIAPDTLSAGILDLCRRNNHSAHARVRLVVFRGESGLYGPPDNSPNYIIQTWALPAQTTNSGQEDSDKGWRIDIFPHGRKSADALSNLKSNNYLIYVLAALHAQAQQLNDCLVLNGQDRIADSSIANLFYCRGSRIYTPPLSEGCVAGVMRRFLLTNLPELGFELHEKETTIADLESADEVFLTNAVQGIRPVSFFRGASYANRLSTAICHELLSCAY